MEGSLLDINFENVHELETIPEGTEVRLTIKEAGLHTSKAGNTSLKVVFEDLSNENVDDIYVYLTIPTESFKETNYKAWRKTLKRMEQFYDCFDIPRLGSIDVSKEMAGKSGMVIVGEEADNDGGTRNTIRKYLA